MDLSLLASQLLNALTLGGIYALIAVGYTMVYGIIKLINFAHGEIYMIGAFSGLLLINAGVPFAAALPASMLICAALGILIDQLAYKPLRKAPRLSALITAIGMSLFLQNIAMLIWSPSERPFPDLYPARSVQAAGEGAERNGAAFLDQLQERMERPNPDAPAQAAKTRREGGLLIVEFPLGSAAADTRRAVLNEAEAVLLSMREQDPEYGLSDPIVSSVDHFFNTAAFSFNVGGKPVDVSWKALFIWAVTIVFMLALEAVVHRTRVGMSMRACALDQTTASLMGIDVNRIIALTFAIGSAMAAAAGVLFALYRGSGVGYRMGFQPGFFAFSAAVLGGIGNIRGAMIGGLILGGVQVLTQAFLTDWIGIESTYSFAFAFALLILVILLKPTGILGSSSAERA